MPRKRYSPEEVIHKLREAEVLLSQDYTAQEAARQLGIAGQTDYRWPCPKSMVAWTHLPWGAVPGQARRGV